MAFPTFLGIGAQRCGSTLLHTILETHPEIYVPRKRKEIHFFDRNFERGLGWYQSFFPDEKDAGSYRAVGEITPDYIYFPDAAARLIETVPADCRFIITLRHPTRRAFSGYIHHRRAFNERRPFERFIEEQEDVLARGFYSRQIERYLDAYPKEQFLILIFEEWLKDPAQALGQVERLLGLSRGWPDPEAVLAAKEKKTTVPYFATPYYWARSFGQMLSRRDLDWIVNIFKAMNVQEWFGKEPAQPKIAEETRERLDALYREEVAAMEGLLGRSIPAWHT